MGLVIEICVKHPGGPTRIKVTEMESYGHGKVKFRAFMSKSQKSSKQLRVRAHPIINTHTPRPRQETQLLQHQQLTILQPYATPTTRYNYNIIAQGPRDHGAIICYTPYRAVLYLTVEVPVD
jgi:hypothetical protein